MKLKFILMMILPMMRMSVQLLRDKDSNSSGFDDVAANQLDTAINSLELYLSKV